MRFILPIILIGTSVMVFIMFTNPLYSSTDLASPGIEALKGQIDSLNAQLDNYQIFDGEKEKLTTKKNGFNPDDLAKLDRLLPESVDNIRLILEIEKIADPYGMVLRDIKYDSTAPANSATSGATGTLAHGDAATSGSNDYGIWNLEFSTTASYPNFISFMKDLESNLRIVDISSIQFSSGDSVSGSGPQVYRYTFKIKTYWLRN